MPETHGWRAFTPHDLERMTREDRAGAERALAEYEAREPLAEVHIRIFDWQPGQSEVRFGTPRGGTPEDPAWHDRLFDTAIEELRRGKAIFGTE